MSEYLGMFLEEAEEQVETFDDGLLRLEEEPDNQELLQGIFRAAHSLKSSAAAMGFASMSRLCHASESVLDKLRSGAMRPETAVIDVLLRAVDGLKKMKEAVRSGGSDELDVREVVAALEAVAKEAEGGEREPGQGSGWSAEAGDGGGELEKPPPGSLCVVVRLTADCAMPAVRWQMAVGALKEVGEVIAARPSAEEVKAGSLGREFTLVAVVEGGEEAVRQALESVSEIESVEICEAGREREGAADYSDVRQERAAEERVADVGPAGRGRSPRELAGMARREEQTVRVSVALLDDLMNLVGELVMDRTRIAQLGLDLEARHGETDAVGELKETSRHMGRIVGDLQENVMKARMLPIARLFGRFPRMVRDLAQKMGKEVTLALEGEETELDRSVIEEMVDPLGHLLRNAVDHGLEDPEERVRVGKPRKGRIVLAARQEENHIIIEVTDDGAGIDAERVRESAVARGVAAEGMSDEEALQLVFAPGMSTAGTVSDVSGRGVGMDVVRSNVKRLRGTVQIQTKVGLGTTVVVRLPLTLAISQALLVSCREETVAIPLVYVMETTRVPREDLRSIGGRLVTTYRGRVLPLVDLRSAVDGRAGGISAKEGLVRVVVARSEGQEVGFVVDEMVGEQEIVLKSLGQALGDIAGLSGATVLGDGTVALVLDVASLMGHAGLKAANWTGDSAARLG